MFSITITDSAFEDLRVLKKSAQATVLDVIEEQLTHNPVDETRNRKPLRPNDLASWELRIGEYRVFYDVDAANNEVTVKAIGRKEHNKLFIRDEEYQL